MTIDTRTHNRPPANALRVEAWRDLPPDATRARYKIIGANGETRLIALANGNRIILDALIKQPVFCASPVRISDVVSILKRSYGVPIDKKMYENDAAPSKARFGVYFLDGGVERIADTEGRT